MNLVFPIRDAVRSITDYFSAVVSCEGFLTQLIEELDLVTADINYVRDTGYNSETFRLNDAVFEVTPGIKGYKSIGTLHITHTYLSENHPIHITRVEQLKEGSFSTLFVTGYIEDGVDDTGETIIKDVEVNIGVQS